MNAAIGADLPQQPFYSPIQIGKILGVTRRTVWTMGSAAANFRNPFVSAATSSAGSAAAVIHFLTQLEQSRQH